MSENISPTSIVSETIQEWADRRQGGDRRAVKSHPLSLPSLRGQRQRGRRKEDLAGRYVDRYDPMLRVVCLGIILLSCVDAVFTLRILELGGIEVNPVMRFLLEWDIMAFIYVKLLLTSSSICILVAHIHFKWFRLFKVSYVLYASLGMYVTLIAYEVHLLRLGYNL